MASGVLAPNSAADPIASGTPGQSRASRSDMDPTITGLPAYGLYQQRDDGKRRDRSVLGAQFALQTNSSADGPPKGKPALLGAGMMGDRTSVIFADPAEISAFIAARC